VPELVRGDMHGFTEFVCDTACLEPPIEMLTERRGGDGESAVGVGGAAGQQHRGVGELLAGAGLLCCDHGGQFVVNRHHRFAAHLVIAVAQVDPALGIVCQAVQR
jgi:hypothetical protein